MDALLVPRFLMDGRIAVLWNWLACTLLVTSGKLPRLAVRDSRHALSTKHQRHCTLPRDIEEHFVNVVHGLLSVRFN